MTQPDALRVPPSGRREQRKLATRQALQSAALRMFAENGYARTTVRDIASAAGVTERTFFRYFRSKEDLVLGEIIDLIPVLQEHVRARPAAEPPYTAVLRAMEEIAARRGVGLGIMFSGPPARFLSQPTRQAQPVLRELEDGLAEALADRGEAAVARAWAPGAVNGGPAAPPAVVPDLATSVLARACVAAMRATLITYSALPEPQRTLAEALRLAREAFAALARG